MVAQPNPPIVIKAVVGEDRRLIIDLPPDAPTGNVTVMVAATEPAPQAPAIPVNSERERLRAILLAAGRLSIPQPDEVVDYPPNPDWTTAGKRPSDEAIRQAGILPAGARPSEEIIDELRNDD
ncbi:MAG: hypothetical protein LCI00_27275 [Chloroflexi bacterium]|nr:hypothetical protein [Chloroflexota bacterium]MCC6897193.1 hypothetical protein [Anaerolineae bacterium]